MKKNEKRMVLILVVIAIIIIAVLIKVRNKDNNSGGNGADGNGAANEEFVQIMEDGTKLNVSDKLAETKTFSNYEVSNIQLTEQDGQSLILADVKNIGNEKTEVTLVDITALDKDGNEMITIGGIVGDIEPGQSVQLNAAATTDFANAYDLRIQVSQQTQE